MKILYLVQGFPPSIGAAALNGFKIVEYLAKFGHEILVLSPGIFSKTSTFSGFNKISNYDVKIVYSSSFYKIPLNVIFPHYENLTKFFLKLKAKFKPDLILSQYHAYHFASVVGSQLSKILRVPHVIRSHDIFFVTEETSLKTKLLHSVIYPHIFNSIRNCNIFYSVSTEIIKYLLKYEKFNNVNFKLHHNGIDPREFYPFKNQEELKNQYNCENIIFFLGTLSKDFGVQNIIKVLPEILKTHQDTHFLIIGEGPYKRDLQNIIKNFNLSKQVHILGIKPHYEIPYYINNIDIGIGRITDNLMWRYFIPIKCLEYMACKKTYITAPCSKDLIKNDDVGLILKRGFTKKDLVEKLTILIEDKALRKKLGENGFKKINQNFLWDGLMNKFNKEILKIKNGY
jgi:glycosyltransferase involved in cell wall biosynthesis